MAGIDLKDWFSDNVTAAIGFSPATTTPKPVHVLNGLFARALDGPRAPRHIRDLTATRTRVWSTSAADARAHAAEADPSITLPESDEDLDAIRRMLRGLLASDGAVHPSKQSYQVAHLGTVTVDIADARMGELAAQLLLGPGAGEDALVALVATLADRQPNPLWALAGALTPPVTSSDWTVKSLDQVDWLTDPASADLAGNLGGLLRRACLLAANSVDSLDGLKVLATSATWACVIALSQVPNLVTEGPLLPLLCVFGDGRGSQSVRDASSVDSIGRVESAYDRWIASLFMSTVRADFSDGPPTEEEALEYLGGLKPYKVNRTTNEPPVDAARVLRQLPAMFTGSLSQAREGSEPGDEPVSTAISLALADVLKATMTTNGPEWLAAAGRRCGFIGPRRGKRAARRFCIEIPLLPTLVLAALDEDEARLDLDDVLSRLESRFGLLVGPSASARSLRPRPTEADLYANRRMLSEALELVGLAHSYSDNTTEVLNPLHLWSRDGVQV